jgi:hypothetical protein
MKTLWAVMLIQYIDRMRLAAAEAWKTWKNTNEEVTSYDQIQGRLSQGLNAYAELPECDRNFHFAATNASVKIETTLPHAVKAQAR